MGKRIRKAGAVHEDRPIALGELIHASVREAIEAAVHEELAAVLGAARYERSGVRTGYRNGTKERTLTGPTGPLELTLPRALVDTPAGAKEWTSTIVPRSACAK
jgi:transposase-like protein